MKTNLLWFATFAIMGMILLIMELIDMLKQRRIANKCNKVVKGKVIKYTVWNNNGVHFPIVEYTVDNNQYKQTLKYSFVVTKSIPSNKVKPQIESDIMGNNLVINKNSIASIGNPLKEYFPIGTELDVYYNPEKPKESYVMRLIKSPLAKIFALTGLLFLIVAILGLIFIK